MPIFSYTGKANKYISNYLKPIEQDLIPAVNSQLGTYIDTTPIYEKQTIVRYKDTTNNIILELSSNSLKIEDNNALFSTVVYNGARNDVGNINLNNIQEAVEFIHIALNDIGFETEEDKNNETNQDSQENQEDVKNAEDSIQKPESNEKQEENKSKEKTNLDNEDITDQKNKFIDELNRDIDFISSLKSGEDKIEIDFSIPQQTKDNQYKFINVSIISTHIAGNNFYVETDRINPKKSEVLNKKQLVDYISKIIDKTKVIPIILLSDKDNNPIKVPEEDNTNNDFLNM
jgi:hypothetical protein